MFSSLRENQSTKTSIKSIGTAMQNDPLLNNMQSYELVATTNKFKLYKNYHNSFKSIQDIGESVVFQQ